MSDFRMERVKAEAGRRLAAGHQQLTVAGLKARCLALGYRIDRTLDCKGWAKWLTGEAAGETYPKITGYVREIDTGRSAYHFESRRDGNYEALKKLRDEVFAISQGRIFEL